LCVAIRDIKAMGGFGAEESTTRIATLFRTSFERGEHGAANAAEARFGQNVIQHDFSRIRHSAHGDNRVIIDDRYEYRTAGLRNP